MNCRKKLLRSFFLLPVFVLGWSGPPASADGILQANSANLPSPKSMTIGQSTLARRRITNKKEFRRWMRSNLRTFLMSINRIKIFLFNQAVRIYIVNGRFRFCFAEEISRRSQIRRKKWKRRENKIMIKSMKREEKIDNKRNSAFTRF